MLKFLGLAKADAPKNNTNAMQERLKKEREEKNRQIEKNEAYRRAVYQYQTMPIHLKENNVRYARKKNILKYYGLEGKYPALPLANYKLFEEELKTLRAENKAKENERKRLEEEKEKMELEELKEQIQAERIARIRKVSGEDPRPPSPSYGGKRTRKNRKLKKRTRKH